MKRTSESWQGRTYPEVQWMDGKAERPPCYGRRGRGETWYDDLVAYRGMTWMRDAQDRLKWKMLKEGFSQQRLTQP